MRKIHLALLIFTAGVEVSLSTPASSQTACDRGCQIRLLDQVLAGFAARDAKKAPLTGNVRYTENGQVLALDDGFWGTANGIGAYRHYFADPVSGNAAFMGTMRENGDLVIFTLRIRITPQRKVSEIETIVSRPDPAAGAVSRGPQIMDGLGGPNPVWSQPIPIEERMSRDDLIAIANKYFSGLQGNDGKGDYPFADDCYRLENGMQTSGPSPISLSNPPPPQPGQAPVLAGPVPDWMQLGCKAQFDIGWMRFVDRIRERRFLTVDPEHGTVFAMGFFDHSGTLHDFEMANGERIVGTGLKEPYTWEIGEAFRIEKGKIRLIEATLNRAPYGMGSNWPEQEPWPDGDLGSGGY